MTERTYEVPMTFYVNVAAESKEEAIEAAYAVYDAGEVAEWIRIGSCEPEEIDRARVRELDE